MRRGSKIAIVIPALNEREAIGLVVRAVPSWVDDIVVADNGSTDGTADSAAAAGARVVREARHGYGAACLAGVAALDDPDIVVFLDGDFSDHPEEMNSLVDPILDGHADMVIGSRVLGRSEKGALTLQARFGNALACALIRLFWRVRYTDLGPFRAISYSSLENLDMRDTDYGWTVEMQVKAAQGGLRVREVPVSYRRRIGKSKVSGTLRGVVGAGTKILGTIFAGAACSHFLRRAASPPTERLVVFTRYPEPGRTKTRLIPVLGPRGAATLQREMTEHTLNRARYLAAARGVSVKVRFEGGSRGLVQEWLGADLGYHLQGTGDLGERMARAFRDAFGAGTQAAVIVGTDCPGLSAATMNTAFDALRRHDLVVGPATDGGYYLIGLRRASEAIAVPRIFEGVKWGTSEVLEKTLEIAGQLEISLQLLEPLSDVDRPEDLAVWKRAREGPHSDRATPRISVIIPTLDEAERVGSALASVRAGSNVEIIVADGGSDDGTASLAESHGAKVVVSGRGRARQLNAGAAVAAGEALLFLHADTRLPEGFDVHVRRALARPGVVGGAFELCIDSGLNSLRRIEKLANWRSRRLGAPFGDQGLFVRADVFRRMGGFLDVPLMEDLDFVLRLRRKGRIEIISVPVVTSSRRWMKRGVLRATLSNQLAIWAYFLGVAPSQIARWYPR